MRHHKLLCLLPIVLFTAACSTSPVPVAERRQAPRERVSNAAVLSPSAERSARFTITRDSGYVASAASVRVFIDGQIAARLATSETVVVYVTPGRHVVGARFSWGNMSPAEREFVADAQKPVSIRITTDQNPNLDLKPESGYLYE